MNFPIQIDIIRMGLSILYILRGHMIEIQNSGAFIYLKIVLPLQTVQNLMENHILWHFILAFTVCQSTYMYLKSSVYKWLYTSQKNTGKYLRNIMYISKVIFSAVSYKI